MGPLDMLSPHRDIRYDFIFSPVHESGHYNFVKTSVRCYDKQFAVFIIDDTDMVVQTIPFPAWFEDHGSGFKTISNEQVIMKMQYMRFFQPQIDRRIVFLRTKERVPLLEHIHGVHVDLTFEEEKETGGLLYKRADATDETSIGFVVSGGYIHRHRSLK